MAGEDPLVLQPQVRRVSTREVPRVTRSPSTPFGLIWKPWQLQPCGLFPVFPGETLTTISLQMQFWSDPLKANYKNTPWTFEYFTFYVPFTSMPGWSAGTGLGTELITMMEAGTPIAGVDADGNAATYCPPGGADFLLAALQPIVERFFREDGQSWDHSLTDGLPNAHAFAGVRRDVNWKLADAATLPADGRIATPAHLGAEMLQGYADMAGAWESLDDETTDAAMNYQDIVRASGGRARVPDQDVEPLRQVELLAKSRHFDYPVNTVEPSTGVPAVMFGHRLRQRMNKAYRLSDFGFIVPVVCVRPKVFWKNQQGLFADMMLARTNWFLPQADPTTDVGFLTLDDAVGPYKALFDAGGIDYAVDLRNLMRDGEQFLNYAPDAAKDSVVTLPEVDFDRDYPATGDVLASFVDTTNGRFRGNGVVDLSLKTWPGIVGTGQPVRTRLLRNVA